MKFQVKKSEMRHSFLMLLILIFVLIPPYFIQVVGKYSWLDSIISNLSVVLILCYIIRDGLRLNLALYLIIIEYAVLLLSTILNHGLYYTAFSNSTFVVMLCLMLSDFIQRKEKIGSFLYLVRNISLIILVANTIIAIIIPDGIPSITTGTIPQFLYGNVNSTIKYVLPGLCSSFIIDYWNNKRLSLYTILYFVTIFWFCFRIYFMATAFVALIFLAFWMLLKKIINRNPKLVFAFVLISVVAIEFLIVLNFTHSALIELVSGIFGKSLTFSGRSILWYNAYQAISEKIIIGHGLQSTEILEEMIGNAFGAHNYYMDIVFQRGIVGLFVFILIILLVFKEIKWKKPLMGEAYILLGVCCSYLVMFLSEAFYNTEKFHMPVFYILLALLLRENRKEKVLKIIS